MTKRQELLKIALINPPILPGVSPHPPTLPMGLAYLASVLEKEGYEVKVIDCYPPGMDHDKLKTQLTSFEPDIVGITSTTVTIESALLAARAAKESLQNALVVLGGPHATFMDTQILSETPHVDVVVRREGERTALEIAQCIAESRGLHQVLGITFRNDGEITQTQDRPFIQNLDQLPYPAYHLFPLEKYRIFGKKILPIMTSRGCPFQCSFCVSSRMVGREFRARSPKNVVDELEFLKEEYGADAFCFYDDTLTFDKKRILDICEEIKQRKIGVPWDCQTRSDQVSKEILKKMREAGCQLVSFGVESGSQKILNAMRKGTTVDQNRKAIRWAKEVGLLVATSVIIGYAGETKETLRQTMDFIGEVKPDHVYICFAAPYPGTYFYELANKLGWKMSNDYSHYDTLKPAFENPSISNEYLIETRSTFYNHFYSPYYIIRQTLKNNYYSRRAAKVALSYWRNHRL